MGPLRRGRGHAQARRHRLRRHRRGPARPLRRQARQNAPPGAIPCQDPDPATGHWPHWVRVDLDAPAYRWHAEAWAALAEPLPDGTYELCGPAVNGNAEGLAGHVFFRHGEEVLDRVPRTMDGIRKFLERNVMEGIVFHREDGRMAKIRRKDFGLPWGGR